MVEVTDPVEVIGEALERLADEDRSGWSVAAKTQRAVELTKLGARLEATTWPRWGIGRPQAVGMSAGRGSPAAALAWLGGRAKGMAQKFVQTGRLVQHHAATAKSVTNGDLGIDAAHQLGRAVTEKRRESMTVTNTCSSPRPGPERMRVPALIDRWVELADDEVDPDKEFDRFDRRSLTSVAPGRARATVVSPWRPKARPCS